MGAFVHLDEAAGLPFASLSALSDTTITNPTDGQLAKYNGTTQKWENVNAVEIIPIEKEDYDELSSAEKHNPYKSYIITDEDASTGEIIDDTTSSVGTTYSSHKIDQELTSINSKIDKGSVSVTSDGVKTISTLMNTLYALIDKTKISKDSVLVEDDQNGDKRYYYCGHYDSSSIIMTGAINVDTTPRIVYDGYGLRSTGSAYVRTILSNTVTSGNYSTQTPSSGRVYTFYY